MDVVICARNEERTVGDVVRAFTVIPHTRVIVVDDNSTDSTATMARNNGAFVVKGPGIGKGEAMRCGLSFVTSDRVVFADADITGFQSNHAQFLMFDYPGMIVGMRDNGSALLPGLPLISGERSLPTWIAKNTPLSGYESELALNSAVKRAKLPIYTFTMYGVRSPTRAPLRRSFQLAPRLLKNLGFSRP